MKKLKVSYLPIDYKPAVLAQISTLLDFKKSEVIGITPWAHYDYRPAVEFAIAHNGASIFLKYYVSENDVKATYTKINEPVYKDSCVEFFIALQGDESYYNFEFNSMGVCRAGYGKGRENRQLLPAEIINQIGFLNVAPQLAADKNYRWQLCLAFPVTVFCYHQLRDISGGKAFKGNFYKCGDDLAEPHFLAWNNIMSKEPNFHLPEFFGTISFDSISVN